MGREESPATLMLAPAPALRCRRSTRSQCPLPSRLTSLPSSATAVASSPLAVAPAWTMVSSQPVTTAPGLLPREELLGSIMGRRRLPEDQHQWQRVRHHLAAILPNRVWLCPDLSIAF